MTQMDELPEQEEDEDNHERKDGDVRRRRDAGDKDQ